MGERVSDEQLALLADPIWLDAKSSAIEHARHLVAVELQERRAGDAERDAEIERKSLVNKNLRMSIEIMQDNADVEIAALKAEHERFMTYHHQQIALHVQEKAGSDEIAADFEGKWYRTQEQLAALNAKLAQTRGVLEYVERYQDYWRDQPVVYWLGRLIEEIGELSGTLIGSHKGPVGHELRQIASICINWLDYWQLPMCGVLEGDDAKTSRS